MLVADCGEADMTRDGFAEICQSVSPKPTRVVHDVKGSWLIEYRTVEDAVAVRLSFSTLSSFNWCPQDTESVFGFCGIQLQRK